MSNKYLVVLFFMFGLIQVSACSTDENSQTKIIKPETQLSTNNTTQTVKLNAKHSIQQAIENNDYRLLHSKGRRIVVPGLEKIELSLLKSQCGLKALKNSSDVMKNDQQRQQRKTLYTYAKQFNQAMYAICLDNIDK